MSFGTRIAVLLAAVLGLGFGSARGDVVVRVQVTEPNQQAGAAAAAALTVETLAGTNGNFVAKTKLEKQTVELKGGVKQLDKGRYRVHVSFSNQGDGTAQQVSTIIELPMGKPQEIGGLAGAGGQRTVVLTLENEPAK
jgi:hypothetical protein